MNRLDKSTALPSVGREEAIRMLTQGFENEILKSRVRNAIRRDDYLTKAERYAKELALRDMEFPGWHLTAHP